MAENLTPADYSDSARKLGNILDTAVARRADELKRELATVAAIVLRAAWSVLEYIIKHTWSRWTLGALVCAVAGPFSRYDHCLGWRGRSGSRPHPAYL
jgi:hypothetical protein